MIALSAFSKKGRAYVRYSGCCIERRKELMLRRCICFPFWLPCREYEVLMRMG